MVYAHTGTPITAEPFQLAELARTFPDVPMVMGHMGYTDFWYDAVPAALQSENIYLETSLIDMPVTPTAFNASLTSSTLNGLMNATMSFMAIDLLIERR